MANDVVGMDLILRLEKFRADMASIPGITGKEAKLMAAELARYLKQAEAAAKKAGTTMASSMSMVDTVGKSKRSISQLGSALSQISPQAGALISQVSAMTGAAKAASSMSATLGVSLGAIGLAAAPVVTVLGGLYIAYRRISQEAAQEAEMLATQRTAAESLIAPMRALEDATLSLEIATNKLSEAQAEHVRTSLVAQRAVLDFARAQAAQRDEIRRSAESAEKYRGILDRTVDVLSVTSGPIGWAASMAGLTDRMRDGVDELMGWSDQIEQASARTQVLDDAVVRMAEMQRQLRDITRDTADATRAHEHARTSAAAAARDQAAAERELQAALRESEQATERLDEIREQAYQAQLDPMDQLLRRQELELANIEALGRASGDALAAARAYDEVSARQTIERIEMQERLSAEMQARIDREAQASAEAMDDIARRTQAIQTGIASVSADALGSIASIAEYAAKKMSAAGQSQGASRAFAAWRAFAIATALAQGYQAAVAAYASTVAIPVVGPALAPAAAAAAIAAAALQVAKIRTTEMPSYHTGGTLSPDETYLPRAVVTRPEAVLTGTGQRAIGGPAGVERANRGESLLPPLEIAMVYRGRVLDRVLQDLLGARIGAMGDLSRRGGPRPGRRR